MTCRDLKDLGRYCRQTFDSFDNGSGTLDKAKMAGLLVHSGWEGSREQLGSGESFDFKCYVDLVHGSWKIAKVTPDNYTTLGFECNRIDGAENRPMSLKQLKLLREFMQSQTNEAGEMIWVDVAPPQYSCTSGQKLKLDELNLYSTATWLIEPATRSAKCSFSELMNTEAKVPKTFVSQCMYD